MTHRHYYHIVLVLLCGLTVCSCSNSKDEPTAEEGKSGIEVQATGSYEVSVMTLRPSVFHHDVMSNGRLAARRYADLYFSSSETVADIYVHNGESVRSGQKLAALDTFRIENKRRQSEVSFKQSELELQNVLIGQGYAPDRSDLIPAAVMELAMIKSGYAQNKMQHELATYEADHAVLTAPFDGVVANLSDKTYSRASTSGAFCRIIDTRSFEVNFTIIESELLLLGVGDEVEIIPFAAPDRHCRGHIAEINPQVDSKGTVKVKATLDGAPKLYDGMNVKVRAQLAAERALVIPKTAVVMRSGKPVVFTLSNGEAQWNYVEIAMENLDEYAITGLKEGDVVITSGNLNLAHETKVTVVGEKS